MIYKFFISIIMLTIFIYQRTYSFGEPVNRVPGPECNNTQTDGKESEWGIVPIAVPILTPDTGWAIGVLVLNYINSDKNNPGSKPDELMFYGIYTQYHQRISGLFLNKYFWNYDINWSLTLEWNKWPNKFYGINASPNDKGEKYTLNIWYYQTSLLFNIKNVLYIGPLYEGGYIDICKRQGPLLFNNDITGNDKYLNSGIGFHILYDSRDSSFYPGKGCFIEMKGIIFNSLLYSEYNFYSYECNFRHFNKVWKKQVFAYQVLMSGRWGKVPFQSMSKLGSESIIRGFIKYRYIDKISLSVQSEYRFPIIWRFDGAAFLGAGFIGPKPDLPGVNDLRYAGGIGIRFTVDKKNHINFRIDLTVNDRNDKNIYAMLKEAF